MSDVCSASNPLIMRFHTKLSTTVCMFCCSILPTDVAYFWMQAGSDCSSLLCPVWVRINRVFRSVEWCSSFPFYHSFVLRLDRMIEFFERTETRTNSPNAFRILQVFHSCSKLLSSHSIKITILY